MFDENSDGQIVDIKTEDERKPKTKSKVKKENKLDKFGIKNLDPKVLRAIRDRLVYEKIKQEHLEQHPELVESLNRNQNRPQTASKKPKRRIKRTE